MTDKGTLDRSSIVDGCKIGHVVGANTVLPTLPNLNRPARGIIVDQHFLVISRAHGDNVILASPCHVRDINPVCVGLDSLGPGYVDDIHVPSEDLAIAGDTGREGCFCAAWRRTKRLKWHTIIEDNADSLVMNVDLAKS